MLIATLWHALVMLLFHGRKSNQKFPKQRRLCEQRRSTVACIRSCPARLGVCGTCERKLYMRKEIIYANAKKRLG